MSEQISITKIPVFKDNRGYFFASEISKEWIQSNLSYNDQKYTFRGMHLQFGEFAQTKKVTVIQGQIIDFVLDLRPHNFGKVQKFLLNQGETILVPNYCAHGFLTLVSNTIVNYFIDKPYNKDSEFSIKWSTIPEIKNIIESEIKDSTSSMVISDKDENALSIDHFYQHLINV